MSTPTQNTQTEKQNLVMTHVFDAPVDLVWKAWIDPEYIKQWWGPDGFTGSVTSIDFREGGTALVSMSNPDFGTHYSLWQYQTIVPMQRINYIHNLADQDGNKVDPVTVGMPSDFPQDQLQEIIFRSLDDNRTELTVIEHGWIVGQMMEMSRMGMEQCLMKIAALLPKI